MNHKGKFALRVGRGIGPRSNHPDASGDVAMNTRKKVHSGGITAFFQEGEMKEARTKGVRQLGVYAVAASLSLSLWVSQAQARETFFVPCSGDESGVTDTANARAAST